MSAPAITRFVVAEDGTRIAYHVYLDPAFEGEGALAARPTLLLTSGIGTTPNFWRFLVEALRGAYRVVHWDYRGHGASGAAASGDYRLPVHADDLLRVTRALGGGPPAHVAFSMGVAVTLELVRVSPELVPRLALVAGVPDSPVEDLFRVPGLRRAVALGLEAATPLVPFLAPAVFKLLTSGAAYPVGRAVGLLRQRSSREDIDAFMRGIAQMDPKAYWQTLRGLLLASTSEVLPRVQVPTLLLEAEHDWLVSARQMKALRAALPRARYVRVSDAGHAGLLEAGPEIAALLSAFLAEAGVEVSPPVPTGAPA